MGSKRTGESGIMLDNPSLGNNDTMGEPGCCTQGFLEGWPGEEVTERLNGEEVVELGVLHRVRLSDPEVTSIDSGGGIAPFVAFPNCRVPAAISC